MALAPGEALRRELDAAFAHPLDAPLDDDAFDRLARAAFAFQLEHNAAYAAYCARRGRLNVDHWTEIPAVPTAGFKELPLVAGDPARAEAVFRTSGTTRGRERRGQHFVLDLSLYRRALTPMFAGYVLPDDARPVMLSLTPTAADVPDSSLSYMIGAVLEQFGAPGSGTFMSVGGGLDRAGLERALAAAGDAGTPVCLLGTSLAFAHWLDALDAADVRFRLPAGSRLMDTGGVKGTTRALSPADLRARYQARLGIAATHVVNEYGMTEMCSQFYDCALRDALCGGGGLADRKRPAPWVRTRVVDPETLAPLSHGDTGLLQHFDLANLYSVCAIQTEDLGREVDDGFLLLGRAPGAAPRGCSIAMDLLLESARR